MQYSVWFLAKGYNDLSFCSPADFFLTNFNILYQLQVWPGCIICLPEYQLQKVRKSQDTFLEWFQFVLFYQE